MLKNDVEVRKISENVCRLRTLPTINFKSNIIITNNFHLAIRTKHYLYYLHCRVHDSFICKLGVEKSNLALVPGRIPSLCDYTFLHPI